MNATALPPRPELVRPELGALLSVVFLLIDELQSIVLHVSSARPGEGTTTVARDLAAAAAAAGWCRVALVDAHPGAPRALGAASEHGTGLLEYFDRGEAPVLRATKLGSTGIDVARLSSAGQPVSRVESVRGLYATLRKTYSLVVVDCPAVFASQQTLVLAAAANETILVMEAERTPIGEVARAREALEQRGASILGVVMNKRRRRIPRLLEKLL
jgi:Mrp family chromosome partitioning ATPase